LRRNKRSAHSTGHHQRLQGSASLENRAARSKSAVGSRCAPCRDRDVV